VGLEEKGKNGEEGKRVGIGKLFVDGMVFARLLGGAYWMRARTLY
jgi:hypothetical protein